VIAGIIVDSTRDAIRRGKLVRDMDVAALAGDAGALSVQAGRGGDGRSLPPHGR
jgi:hypothetical protein